MLKNSIPRSFFDSSAIISSTPKIGQPVIVLGACLSVLGDNAANEDLLFSGFQLVSRRIIVCGLSLSDGHMMPDRFRF
jgi:hypothetical protein